MNRLTEKQIDKDIQEKYAEFYAAKYTGTLPEDIIDLFKIALMDAKPSSHQYRFLKIREMLAKKPDELNNMEVGMIINLIIEAPLEKIFPSLSVAIERMIEIESHRSQYNLRVDEINKSLQREKAAKMRILQ